MGTLNTCIYQDGECEHVSIIGNGIKIVGLSCNGRRRERSRPSCGTIFVWFEVIDNAGVCTLGEEPHLVTSLDIDTGERRHLEVEELFLSNKVKTSQVPWRHNDRDGVSNHQPHDCFLNRLFRRRSKKTSKPRVTGLCEGNSPVIIKFPAQKARSAENISIWLHHHENIFSVKHETPSGCTIISSN